MEEGRNERKVLIVSMNVDWMNSPILRQGQRLSSETKLVSVLFVRISLSIT